MNEILNFILYFSFCIVMPVAIHCCAVAVLVAFVKDVFSTTIDQQNLGQQVQYTPVPPTTPANVNRIEHIDLDEWLKSKAN